MEARKRIIIACVLCYFVGAGMGFIWGSYESVKIIAGLAAQYVNVDSDLLAQMIFKYKEQITPDAIINIQLQNASYINDTGH